MCMKKIYEKIAEENGISGSEVKREMQAAIDNAYKNVRKSETEKSIQESIPYHGDTPTVEEFIESFSYKYKCQLRK